MEDGKSFWVQFINDINILYNIGKYTVPLAIRMEKECAILENVLLLGKMLIFLYNSYSNLQTNFLVDFEIINCSLEKLLFS